MPLSATRSTSSNIGMLESWSIIWSRKNCRSSGYRWYATSPQLLCSCQWRMVADWYSPWCMVLISHSAYGCGSLLRLRVVNGHGRYIKLLTSTFPALSNLAFSSYIIAAADAIGVFVTWAHGAGVVAIDVKTGRVRKVFRYNIVNIISYMSFCTPGNCLMSHAILNSVRFYFL